MTLFLPELNIKREYLQGKTLEFLAQKYETSKTTIASRLKKLGVTPRPPSVNARRTTLDDTFFDIVDSEEKAYWLGFVFADGYLSKKENRIKVSLAEIDRTHLQKLQRALKNNSILYFRMFRSLSFGVSRQYELTVSSKKLHASLVSLGMREAKGGNPRRLINSIPGALRRHFWRGVVDGDGAIYWAKKRTRKFPGFSLCGDKKTLEEFQIFVRPFLRCGPNIVVYPSLCYWSVTRSHAVDVLKLLYHDSKVYLDRKHKMLNRIYQYKPVRSAW